MLCCDVPGRVICCSRISSLGRGEGGYSLARDESLLYPVASVWSRNNLGSTAQPVPTESGMVDGVTVLLVGLLLQVAVHQLLGRSRALFRRICLLPVHCCNRAYLWMAAEEAVTGFSQSGQRPDSHVTNAAEIVACDAPGRSRH